MIKIDALDANIDPKDISAFIQQQMVELTPHLSDQAALQIRLVKKEGGFEVELTAFETSGEVQTVGFHADIYDAIRNAKEGLLEYFVEVEDALDPGARDQKIQFMTQQGSLYLH